jgi:DNA-binding NarL/FixJ family response regulator
MANGDTLRILVVDDFEPWRRQVCSMLQTRREFRVVGEAADGLEAVQQAQELNPDLILLDIGLPSLNGLAAANRIRRFSPDARIVFLTQRQRCNTGSPERWCARLRPESGCLR